MGDAENTAAGVGPKKSDPWTDLALTLPIFVCYHLGVAFLPVRNAADPVTSELKGLANHSLLLYAGLTLGVGAGFVVVLALLGKQASFQKRRFVLVGIEGMLYAVLMRVAGSYVVGSLRLGPAGSTGPFSGAILAMGAGFYEEIAFRAGLFGIGAWAIRRFFGPGSAGATDALQTPSPGGSGARALVLTIAWGCVAAGVFSGWHYIGSLGDSFELSSFVFRWVCGMVLTTIFALRGFAPAVWTHVLYDVWVMALR